MRLINIDALQGMEKLEMAIRKGNGAILLPAGAILTDSFKSRLKKMGIVNVYIEDDLFQDVEAIPALEHDVKNEAIQKMAQVFQNFERGKPLDVNAVSTLKKTIYESVRRVIHRPINLFDLYVVENEKVLHAVNTATMTAALGASIDLKHQVVEDLVAAALLHDMALTSMYGKESPDHVDVAFQAIKETRSISSISYMAVGMHHENYDGTGYPRGATLDQIHEGAKILAICDMYDSLVNGYSGLNKLAHYHALEYINAHSGTLFDPSLVKTFNQVIAIYPNGSTVRLNSGRQAVVMMQNKNMPARPVIKYTEPVEGLYYELDLLKDNTVFIEKLEN